ncbi:hypothetical protein ACQP1V_34325 [Microtetraspora malaysiensis]|uniref:hypothetical protein n=1 Tax=Microtetraspora malaysiensis TaxID=161358 RepID=UPI003D8CB09E
MSEHFQPAARPNVPPKRRRRLPQIAAVTVAGALIVGGLTGCDVDDEGDPTAEIGAAKNEIAVRKAMQELVKAGFPGVMVSVKGKDGKTRDYGRGRQP